MGDIIDLESRKNKKRIDEELARGRNPLYISHKEGSIRPSHDNTDFSDRVSRIRASLEKLNRLMEELKNTTKKDLT